MAGQIVTSDSLDITKVSFTNPYDSDLGYRTCEVRYSLEDSTNDKFAVKVSGKVNGIFVTNDNNKTNVSMLLNVKNTDEIIKITDELNKTVYDNREKLFENIKLQGKPAPEKLSTEKKFMNKNKPFLLCDENYDDKYTLSVGYNPDNVNVSLPQNVSKDKIPEEYREICVPLSDEMYENTDTSSMIKKGMILVMVIEFRLSINLKTAQWRIKSLPKQIYGVGMVEVEDRDPHSLYGNNIDDIEVDNISFTDVGTKGPNNGKFIQCKYNGKGFNMVFSTPLSFNKGNYNGKDTYSIGIPIGDINKFYDTDNAIKSHLFNNQRDIFGKVIDDDDESFADNYVPTLKYNEKYNAYTLWVKMWVGEGLDFQGTQQGKEKFFKRNKDGSVVALTNDEIMKQLFLTKGQITSDIQVYHKHVWLGTTYSNTWHLSKVIVSMDDSVEYDLGFSSIPRDEESGEDEFGRSDVNADTTAVESGDEETSDEEED